MSDPVATFDPFTASGLQKVEHDDMASAMKAFADAPAGVHNAILIDGTFDQSDGPVAQATFAHRSDDGHVQIGFTGGYGGTGGWKAGAVASYYF